jgi:hypothetical protein
MDEFLVGETLHLLRWRNELLEIMNCWNRRWRSRRHRARARDKPRLRPVRPLARWA